jgi:phage tail-like protein
MSTPANPYWLLDGVAGWQTSSTPGIFETPAPDLYLTLEPLPGTTTLLAVTDGPVWPLAIAAEGDGLLATDAEGDRVVVIENGKAHVLAGVGGHGVTPRLLRNPRGVASLAGGSFAVSDTGNNRVQIFSRVPYALLEVVEGFERPWGLAVDAQGRLLVADRGHGRITRFRPLEGTRESFGNGVLDQPTQVACAPGGDIAVVDRRGVIVFAPGDSRGRRIESIQGPLSVVFDPDGALYVGTSAGLLFKLLPDATVFARYSIIWSGPAGEALQTSVPALVWSGNLGLVMIVHTSPDDPSQPQTQAIWQANPSGAYVAQGSFVIGPLDSAIDNCNWHRIQLLASVPTQTTVQVETFTSSDRTTDVTDQEFDLCLQAGSGQDDPDCLVQSQPGQFIWLRVTLGSGGVTTPAIRAIKVWYPRQSYLQYLPAVYQQDPDSRFFLDRFLSLFQSEFDGFDQQLDNLWRLFEPLAITGTQFQWLASWLALDILPTWTDQQRSTALKHAYQGYTQRGTIAGIVQAISDYAGIANATIIEDYKLRKWALLPADQPLSGGIRLWSQSVYNRLRVGPHSRVGRFQLVDDPPPTQEAMNWGANRFRVLFPASPYNAASQAASVQQVVEQQKPVHTEAVVVPILPRLRLGVQSTIGIDAAVGGVSYLVLSSTTVTNLSTLGYDTILGCSKPRREIESLGLAVTPRAGVDAVIL